MMWTRSIAKVPAARNSIPKFRGNYLLEFAAVLAVLLPILIGAVDITTALQAYTAVKESSVTAARCLFPTDGACVTTTDYSPATRRYDWYRGTRTERYFIPYDNFSGTGYLLQSAGYRWDQYEAQVYTSVSYQAPQRLYQLVQNLPARSQPLRVVVEHAGLPLVLGDNPSQPSGFVYALARHSSHNGELAANVIEHDVTNSQDAIINITPPAWSKDPAFGAIRCVRSKEADRASSQVIPDFSTGCSSLGSGPTPMFPIAFWIGGDARGGNVGESSGLSIRLNYFINGIPQSFSLPGGGDLGGQVFGNPGGGNSQAENFHPRGFKREGVSQEMFNAISSDPSDIPQWAASPLMIPAQASKITITLHATSNFSDNLTYRVREVRVFAPIFTTIPFEASCTSTTCAAAAACTLKFEGASFGPGAGQIPIVKVNAPWVESRNAVLAEGEEVLSIQRTAIGDPRPFITKSLAEQALLPKNSSCDALLEDVGAAGNAEVKDQPCPRDPLLGTLPGKKEGCLIDAGGMAQNVSYSTATTLVPQTQLERVAFDWDYSWNPNSCGDRYHDEFFSPPTGLQRYESFLPASFLRGPTPSTYNATVPLPSGSDPRSLLKSENRFNCEAFSVATVTFEGDSAMPSPITEISQSLFAGTHPRYRGTPECLGGLLRDEAVRYGFPEWGYFEPNAAFAEEREQQQPPTSECIPYRTQPVLTDAVRVAEKLPEGVEPMNCPASECYAIFSDSLAETSQGPRLDLSFAQHWGQQELLAAYPRAKFGCAQGVTISDCAWVTASQLGDEIEIEAAINVPFNFLGRSTHLITQRSRRKIETSYLK